MKTDNTKEVKPEEVEHVVAEEVPHNSFDISIIDNTLTKHNVTQQALEAMKEFKQLQIHGIADKEGYKIVDEKRKFVKKVRTLAQNLCKDGRADAITIQKAWIAKEKEVVGVLSDIEDDLEAKQKVVDDENKRIKEEEDKRKAIREQERVTKLISLGMTLQGDLYILGGHTVSVLHCKVYDDITWNSVLAPIEAEAAAIAEQKRLEDEAFKKLQAEQALEREKLEREKREFEEMKRKQQEEENARLEAARKENERIEAEKKQLLEARVKSRKSTLFSLGYAQQFDNMVLKGMSVSDNILQNQSEEEWLLNLENLKHHSDKVKEQLEKERLENIEKEKQAAVEAERKRIEAEQKAKDEAEAKAKREAEEAARKAEEEKKRLEAMAPDLDKYNLFIKSLGDIVVPEFATDEYKAFGAYMQETINKMVNHFNKEKGNRIK